MLTGAAIYDANGNATSSRPAVQVDPTAPRRPRRHAPRPRATRRRGPVRQRLHRRRRGRRRDLRPARQRHHPGRRLDRLDDVGASRRRPHDASCRSTPRSRPATDGDDYIEGGGGNDVIFGNLGQDDIIGGSSDLFGLTTPDRRARTAPTSIFGGAGTRIGRNDPGDTSATRPRPRRRRDPRRQRRHLPPRRHRRRDRAFLTFNYDNYDRRRAQDRPARGRELLDYTPGGPDFDASRRATRHRRRRRDPRRVGRRLRSTARPATTCSSARARTTTSSAAAATTGSPAAPARTASSATTAGSSPAATACAEPLYGIAATRSGRSARPGTCSRDDHVPARSTKTVDLTPFNLDRTTADPDEPVRSGGRRRHLRRPGQRLPPRRGGRRRHLRRRGAAASSTRDRRNRRPTCCDFGPATPAIPLRRRNPLAPTPATPYDAFDPRSEIGSTSCSTSTPPRARRRRSVNGPRDRPHRRQRRASSATSATTGWSAAPAATDMYGG